MLAAANMDPEANDNPENLIWRDGRIGIWPSERAFTSVSAISLRVSKASARSTRYFARWPKLALAVDDSQIRWRERPGIRALASLPVLALLRGQRIDVFAA